MEQSGEYSCDTTLALGLKHTKTEATRRHHVIMMPHEPLLSLSLSGPTCQSVSALSFSKTTQVVERYSPDVKKTAARRKLRLNKDQLAILETTLRLETTINSKQKHDLAKKLDLKPRQVEVWIQNRKARTKTKQAKVDRELLKEYYQVLSSENQRLQEEIKELKTQISCPPAYQYGAVTNNGAADPVIDNVKLCQSCKRISDNASAVKLELVTPS